MALLYYIGIYIYTYTHVYTYIYTFVCHVCANLIITIQTLGRCWVNSTSKMRLFRSLANWLKISEMYSRPPYKIKFTGI